MVRKAHSRLSFEYPIRSERLYGTLDYFLQKQPQVVVIEAKRDDMENGFNQLAAELIALNGWAGSSAVEVQPTLIGAVTTGTLWQFGLLERNEKQVVQTLNTYRVPEDLDALMRILVQALV